MTRAMRYHRLGSFSLIALVALGCSADSSGGDGGGAGAAGSSGNGSGAGGAAGQGTGGSGQAGSGQAGAGGATCGLYNSGGVCTACAIQMCCVESNACRGDALCFECFQLANKGDILGQSQKGCSSNPAFSALVDCVNDPQRCGPICNPNTSCGSVSCSSSSQCTAAGCSSCTSAGVCQ